MLTAPRQVIALLELPTMQLAGNKGPAMAVDTMREVDARHANPAVVAAFEPPVVQIVPLLHAPPCKYTCTSQAEEAVQVIRRFIRRPFYPQTADP